MHTEERSYPILVLVFVVVAVVGVVGVAVVVASRGATRAELRREEKRGSRKRKA